LAVYHRLTSAARHVTLQYYHHHHHHHHHRYSKFYISVHQTVTFLTSNTRSCQNLDAAGENVYAGCLD
jgi:hypothetical protein